MQFENFTELKSIEPFILDELKKHKTEFPRNRKFGKELTINLKWADLGDSRASVVGYFRYKDFMMNCRVNKNALYPLIKKMPVGSKKLNSFFFNKPFRYIYDQEVLNNHEEAMVWVFAHELWHFLCKSKQAKGNFETKANKFAFEMLRKYKKHNFRVQNTPPIRV